MKRKRSEQIQPTRVDLPQNQEESGNSSDPTNPYMIRARILFETCVKEDGTPYTAAEVERLSPDRIGTKITNGWLSKILNGQVQHPTMTSLKELTDFFGVHPSFWFTPIEDGPKMLSSIPSQTGGDAHTSYGHRIATRADRLSEQSQKMLTGFLDLLEANSTRSSTSDRS